MGIHNHPDTGVINHKQIWDQQIIDVCPENVHKERKKCNSWWKACECSICQWHNPEMHTSEPQQLRDAVLMRHRKIPVMIKLQSLELFQCPHWFVFQSTSDYKINQFSITGNIQLSVPLHQTPTATTLSHDSLRSFPSWAWEVKSKSRSVSPW